MDEENIKSQEDLAMDIVTDNIVEITKEYSLTKDSLKSKKLREKLNVLKQIEKQIYIGNNRIVNKVINKNKEGIL